MPNERILSMIECVGHIEAHAIMSPTEAALLDLIKSLINEIQMLDAELSILSAGEGPTGCADDADDDLNIALRRLGRDGLNKVLRETLGTPNPLYVDEFGNG